MHNKEISEPYLLCTYLMIVNILSSFHNQIPKPSDAEHPDLWSLFESSKFQTNGIIGAIQLLFV